MITHNNTNLEVNVIETAC